MALGRAGKRPEAESAFREAIRLRPKHTANYGNLGTVCLEQGKVEEAEAAFRQGIELAPKEPGLRCQLGAVLELRKLDDEAEASYRAAVEADPKHVDGHVRLAKLLAKTGRHADAEGAFRQATILQPDRPAHWVGLGGSLEAQGKGPAAEAAYRVAVGLNPNDAEAHNNLGVALAGQFKWAEAEVSYRKALDLAPRMAMVHNNLGNNLRAQDRLADAEAALREAVRLQPRYAEAHNNLGIVLVQQRRVAEGLACYDEALRLRPDYPEAHLNRSLMLLSTGDLERGWPEYEWRFQMRHRKRPAPFPEWDGSPLDGRSLLIVAEQGLGDVVQFMRYAPLIPRGTGGSVALDCPEPLVELAKTCAGIDRVVPRGKGGPKCDLSVPILTLPRLLKTTLDTVPADIPYISTDPERVVYWRNQLAGLPGVRVGIAWQGSLDHRGDRIRSVPLARFAALAQVPGVTLLSLQKGHGIEQLAEDANRELRIHDFGSRTASGFEDTAALVQNLDLVVTVDTAIGHVAGALGVPAWIMIAAASDWRWLLDREDSPWYPTVRLFRQPKPGDWETVFDRLAAALGQWPQRLRAMTGLTKAPAGRS